MGVSCGEHTVYQEAGKALRYPEITALKAAHMSPRTPTRMEWHIQPGTVTCHLYDGERVSTVRLQPA